MSDEQHKSTRCKFCGGDHIQTEKKIDDMHMALLGNVNLGIPGVVNRLAWVEKDVRDLKENCQVRCNTGSKKGNRILKIAVTPTAIIGFWEAIKAFFTHGKP
jgi:hypothetical protein